MEGLLRDTVVVGTDNRVGILEIISTRQMLAIWVKVILHRIILDMEHNLDTIQVIMEAKTSSITTRTIMALSEVEAEAVVDSLEEAAMAMALMMHFHSSSHNNSVLGINLMVLLMKQDRCHPDQNPRTRTSTNSVERYAKSQQQQKRPQSLLMMKAPLLSLEPQKKMEQGPK